MKYSNPSVLACRKKKPSSFLVSGRETNKTVPGLVQRRKSLEEKRVKIEILTRFAGGALELFAREKRLQEDGKLQQTEASQKKIGEVAQKKADEGHARQTRNVPTRYILETSKPPSGKKERWGEKKTAHYFPVEKTQRAGEIAKALWRQLTFSRIDCRWGGGAVLLGWD